MNVLLLGQVVLIFINVLKGEKSVADRGKCFIFKFTIHSCQRRLYFNVNELYSAFHHYKYIFNIKSTILIY